MTVTNVATLPEAPKKRNVRISRKEIPETDPALAKTRIRARGKPAEPIVEPVAPARAIKTKPTEVVESPATQPAFKLKWSPRGMKQFTYTLAVFTLLGGFDKKRKAMPLADIVAFYASKKVITYNLDQGYLAEAPNGTARLTEMGLQHFVDRITGSVVAREIHQKEVDAFVAALRTGKLPYSTEHCSKAETEFAPIKLITSLA